MNIFDKDFWEMLSSQVVSVIGGLLAGTFLALYTNKLLLIPGILIMLPGFLEMRGNISGSFASRLSSGMFLKVINPNSIKTRIVRENFIASFILAVIVSLMLGIVAFLFNYLFFGIVMLKIILLPIFAGIIANAIEIPITLLVTFYLFKKGHDPNNIIGPFVTTMGDVVSISSLIFMVVVLT